MTTRRSRRHALVLAGGAAVSAVSAEALAACGLGPRAESGTTGDAGGQPVKVSLISRPSEEETFKQRTAAFNERYPKIVLEYLPIPGDYVQVIRTNTAAPNPQTMRALTAEVQAVLDLPR